MSISNAGATNVSLKWSTSWDNDSVAGYGVYRNGVSIGSTVSTGFTIFGLVCATTYTFAVDAFDPAGNRSAPIKVSGSTATCPPSPSADLFVAPAAASPGGSDTNPCTLTAPCLSFGRAYRVAVPGQTVEIVSGTYPYQRLTYDSSKNSTAPVFFQPAPGASVMVGDLDIGQGQLWVLGAKDIVVKDIRANHVTVWPGAENVTLQNLDARNVQIFGANNILISGGDYGPCTAPTDGANCNSKVDSGPAGQPASNITFDGVVFHDARTLDPVNFHVECLVLFPASNVIVRNSKFYSCDVYDILAATPQPGLLIENNWFAMPLGNRSTALSIDSRRGPLQNTLIRFNSFNNSGVLWDDAGTGSTFANVRFVGNIARSSCYSSVTFRYNVWQNGPSCGDSTNVTLNGGSFPYVRADDGPSLDYHLTGGVAVDLVRGNSDDAAIGADIDSNPRPQGAGRDAGANELR